MSVKQGGKTIAGATQYHPDLFDFKRSDHILNDAQWLMADTFSWQYGSMYKVAYAHLAADIVGKTLQSETIFDITIQFYLADDGHKICPASEESNVTAIYAATGVAWYYIIDTTNQRFKLPRAKHNKYANSLGVVGNGMALGLTDGTYNAGLLFNSGGTLQPYQGNYGGEIGIANSGGSINTIKSGGVTTDPTKSGIIAQQEQDTDQYKYLYFYVGAFTQTALENTAGLNAELFNGKADVSTVAHVVTEFQEPTSANNYTWYRKYADGWVEQGGKTSTDGDVVVIFPIVMADTNYFVAKTNSLWNTNSAWNKGSAYTNPTTTSVTLCMLGGGCWQVSGMAA